MNVYRDRPNTIPWPPIIYSAALVAGLIMAVIVPLPLDRVVGLPGRTAGAVLIALGLALDLAAIFTLRAGQTTVLPHRGSRHLVTSGPFRLSRNPIYLGNTLVVAGLGLAFANGWLMIAAIAAAILTQKIAIEREERHLLALFGVAYESYCKRTRRWL